MYAMRCDATRRGGDSARCPIPITMSLQRSAVSLCALMCNHFQFCTLLCSALYSVLPLRFYASAPCSRLVSSFSQPYYCIKIRTSDGHVHLLLTFHIFVMGHSEGSRSHFCFRFRIRVRVLVLIFNWQPQKRLKFASFRISDAFAFA